MLRLKLSLTSELSVQITTVLQHNYCHQLSCLLTAYLHWTVTCGPGDQNNFSGATCRQAIELFPVGCFFSNSFPLICNFVTLI